MSDHDPTRVRNGTLAVIAACLIWGVAPLFYRHLMHLPAIDVMAHRMLWSLVFFSLFLAVQGRLKAVGKLVTDRRQIGRVALAAIFISFNWFLFIYAVFIDKLSESSLGYYVAPLFSVVLGLVIFRERLTPVKWVAVGLATAAVLILTMGLGAPPWISLVLAVTFASYGAVKKTMQADSMVSVTAEVLMFLPFVLIWLMVFSKTGLSSGMTLVLLILSGPLTAGPLVLFSYAAQRIPMASLGILQFINPTLQFLVALLILGEPMTVWHAIAFPMIWLALAIYSWALLTRERRSSTSRSTEGTV